MNRLGWVDAPRVSLTQWEELTRFAAAVRRDGLTRVVVCGMGGSSLAPQVLAASFGATDRKSTRLNSSHTVISYAVFCLKKKKKSIVSKMESGERRGDVV